MLSIQWQVLYIISIIVTIFVMTTLLLYAVRRRYVSGLWHFIGFMLPAICWALNVGIMALATPESGPVWLGLKYLWIAVTPVMLLLFVLDYTGNDARLNRWLVAGLFVIPAITQVIVWTNQRHGLMLRDLQFAQTGILTYVSTITYGPYYWVHTGYSYFATLICIVLIGVTMRRGSYLYRKQGLLIVAGVATALIGNVLLIARIMPPETDPMPFSLLATCMLLGWSVLRYHMLDLAPIARNVFVDTIPDSMLAINSQGRIIDANRPMLQMIGSPQSQVIGLPVAEVLKPWQSLVEGFREITSVETEIAIGAREFDLLIMPLTDRQAHLRGRLVVLRDITQRKHMEADRERLILTLQETLSEVKRLSGLLPICANCKKIRDDKGYWHQVETYIHDHSEAEFSHGICPECVNRLYPDLYNDA